MASCRNPSLPRSVQKFPHLTNSLECNPNHFEHVLEIQLLKHYETTATLEPYFCTQSLDQETFACASKGRSSTSPQDPERGQSLFWLGTVQYFEAWSNSLSPFFVVWFETSEFYTISSQLLSMHIEAGECQQKKIHKLLVNVKDCTVHHVLGCSKPATLYPFKTSSESAVFYWLLLFIVCT